ncbi:hypothetical protein [Magnetospirillum gryphiswaldense]|uniref:Uncharacterized protein n=2 Tax=Magnetospirillum gryphiswaldense TaxID=55518 RepID=V6EX56_MAGGM|nr:hypothetical protein [Magnetospirillum gryphiswaldense]AVM73187.1 hypothetical protein MSR1_06790 [Magnetospirillum gryphiswaldense MSR-1]AVM77090.1 hypothetical protein MSR1L_06790 [Magnetospirillum gryphiswaldense]CAM75266.1 hypothetical protein MGR_3527 [Magnetospirillum gryphiswaldense MSR-1]CDK97835.1 protein of unknown function [Magnetospirillum gryphiswaldense MSR-1 v2]
MLTIALRDSLRRKSDALCADIATIEGCVLAPFVQLVDRGLAGVA